MANFTHLHVHTQYSLLDGLNRSEALLEKVKEDGMESCAITDHGVMYGIPEFWAAASDAGVKPIIGCEIYLAPKKQSLRQEVDGIKYYHLLLLAKNMDGYKNLSKLTTTAHLEGFYYRPRIDIETLKKHSEGLICTTACLAGPVARHILRDELPKAEEWLKNLKAIFKDDFYLEIQRNGLCCKDEIDQNIVDKLPEDEKEEQLEMLKQQAKVNKKLYEYSDRFKVPVIATTDAHYLDAEDKDTQKVLFAIKDGKTLDDSGNRKGYLETHIKTQEELQEIFSDIPEVLENTLKIDEKIEAYSIKFDRVQPQYWKLAKDKTAREELQEQTIEGAKKKFGKKIPADVKKQLDWELKIIHDKGYDDYFLVVGDLMQFARDRGIVIGVRGSAAGCLVSYCLGITNVDPLRWGLVFERFLNPERKSPPDIDMDIQDDRRDEVIDYAREKYGERNVAGIITFGKLATKAAIRDVGRVMGLDLAKVDKLSKMVITLFGKNFSFEKMMEEDEEFKRMVETDPELIELGEKVKQIEGLNRHAGVHAAGYLITPKPIDEYMAFQKDNKVENLFVTQMDGNWIDKLDYMKFDFLGLRTLTIIKNTMNYIKDRHDVDIDLLELPEDDPETFKLFTSGDTIGVFQFESPPLQQYLRELKPETIDEICFLAAAYRPGPMQYIPDYIKIKFGEKKAEYLIPELEPILEETFGFPIYQEQLLQICMQLGGFSLGDGDVIRNALKKKILEILQTKEEDFKKAFVEKFPHYGEEIAEKLWGQLKPFADYGFNKAHSASYAVVAYWCAYLKAHYPLEFITALMHSDLENTDRVVIDIKDAKKHGFEILPPDINKSGVYFLPEGKKGIRFGLGAIKNAGVKACRAIVKERRENGEFSSMDDLVNRVGPKNVSKKVVECLVMVGALDEFGDRNALLEVIPAVFQKAQKNQKAEEVGQTGLFAAASEADDGVQQFDATALPAVDEATEKEKIAWEKELLGLFISVHPLEKFKFAGLKSELKSTDQLDELDNQEQVKLLGMFSEIKLVRTKAKNEQMAIVSIEDIDGKYDAVMFPKTFEKFSSMQMIEEARPFIISGKVNDREGRRSIIIDNLEPAASMSRPSKVTLDIRGVTDEARLKNIGGMLNKEKAEKLCEAEVLYGERNGTRKSLVRYIDIEDDECVNVVREYVI